MATKKKELIPAVPHNRKPTPPGYYLRRIIDETPGLTQEKVAKLTGLSLQTINLIINEKRDITAETALVLGKAFDTSPEMWMGLQVDLSLWRARQQFQAEGRL